MINLSISELFNWNSGFLIIAGPCTIESFDSLDAIAQELKSIGVNCIRGGAYKMRTSPYAFRGLGDNALYYLSEIGKKYNMITVSECIDPGMLKKMSCLIDVLLIGTRNMSNYPLLENLGEIDNPIILKRGMSSTYKEWISSAEYIIKSGNKNVVLCERGIRTFETHTRNTLDISAIPSIKSMTDLPIIIDPSHSTGNSKYIKQITWAAVAAKADGALIETHIQPAQSICDSDQSISVNELNDIIKPIDSLRKLLYL